MESLYLACQPCHTLQRSLPLYDSLRSRLKSQLSRVRKAQSKSNPSFRSRYRNAGSERSKENDTNFGAFIKVPDVEQPAGVSECELELVRPIKTFISGGRSGQVADNVVHLKYEMTQESHGSAEYLREKAKGTREPSGLDNVE